MATFRPRTTKHGIVYDIQVKVKDFATQKTVIKTTTWSPEEKMTPKQEERACEKFAEQFEQSIINMYSASKIETINHNIKVCDYAQLWLERVHNDFSLSYYEMSIRSVNWICRYIGGYRVKEVTPFIIQSFYDALDKETHTVVTVHAKPKLREIMNEKHIKYKDFRYKFNINSGSLANALKGKNVSLKYAQGMADILGVKVESVFFIENTTKLYSAATIEKVKRATQCIFAMAKRQRLVEYNFASTEYISFGRRPKRSIKFLDDKQAKQFFGIVMSCEDIRIRTAFNIFIFTGLRRGEVAGLEWGDIDFENATIHICRTSNHSKTKGIYTKEPKTENSDRTMSISNMLIEQLLEYKKWYIRNKENWGDKWVETDRLFTGERGGPIDPNRFDAWLRKLKKDTDLPPFTVHSLRHTNITLQIAAGVPLTTVSGRAGHSRTSTTTDIYAHFIKTSDQEAADTLNNLFGNKDGE